MLRTVYITHDPFDLALSVAQDLSDHLLIEIIDERLRELRIQIDSVKRRLRAARLSPQNREHYVFIHQLERRRGELSWHRNFRKALAYRAGEQGYCVARAPR
jgi:hypothetical protein